MMEAGLKHKTYSQQKERSQKMKPRNKVFIGLGSVEMIAAISRWNKQE
jgi:hypothetical protein